MSIVEDGEHLEKTPSFYTINLSEPLNFDPEEFDQWVRKVGYARVGKSSGTKYICGEDKEGNRQMFVFQESVDHDVFFVTQIGDMTAKSAGFVRLNFDEYGQTIRRLIWGSSSTLDDRNFLSTLASKSFKYRQMYPVLKNYFDFVE